MALYQGSPTLAESLSQPIVQVVGGPLASTTAVTSAPNPSTFGQQVMITATVGPAGPPSPTGDGRFFREWRGDFRLHPRAVSAQIATCITSALRTETNAIMATYSGDGNYKGSSGMPPQMVNPVPTAVQFVPMPPCRVVDTRNSYGNFGRPGDSGQLVARLSALGERQPMRHSRVRHCLFAERHCGADGPTRLPDDLADGQGSGRRGRT